MAIPIYRVATTVPCDYTQLKFVIQHSFCSVLACVCVHVCVYLQCVCS